jgi:hypothetical protein
VYIPPVQLQENETMKTATRSMMTLLSALLLTVGAAHAADNKTYQVTGPVLEVTDSSITVQKSKEKWQLARTKDTKVTGDLKVGAKVTIMYTMTATSIEAKGGDAKAGDAKAGAAKAGDAKAAPAAAPAKK